MDFVKSNPTRSWWRMPSVCSRVAVRSALDAADMHRNCVARRATATAEYPGLANRGAVRKFRAE